MAEVSGLQEIAANEFQYFLIDGRTPPVGNPEIYNIVYKAWKTNWIRTYSELDSESVPSPNEFFRFGVISVLMWRGSVIGLHFYNFFDSEAQAHLDHPYFELYSEDVWEYLRTENFKRLMPLEYLWVDPRWRRSITKISLSDVLIHCGLEVFRLSDADAAVGITRNDRKVNDAVYRTGADAIAKDLDLHNVKVDLCLWRREKLRFALEGVENELFQSLWSRRHVLTPRYKEFLENNQDLKILKTKD